MDTRFSLVFCINKNSNSKQKRWTNIFSFSFIYLIYCSFKWKFVYKPFKWQFLFKCTHAYWTWCCLCCRWTMLGSSTLSTFLTCAVLCCMLMMTALSKVQLTPATWLSMASIVAADFFGYLLSSIMGALSLPPRSPFMDGGKNEFRWVRFTWLASRRVSDHWSPHLGYCCCCCCCCYIHYLMAFLLGQPVPERQTILGFTGARDDGVAVASAGPFAPRCRQINMPVPHHLVFTDQMPFLPPNQQCQSNEGTTPRLGSVLHHIEMMAMT